MTKEQDFKIRFIAMMQDLQQAGGKDKQAMYLLGSLASDLANDFKQTTWTGAKSVMDGKAYSSLLASFEKEGNEHHQAGRTKHAYAIQALAMSLIVRTQTDPDLKAGEAVLDRLIDIAAGLYRQSQKASTN